MAVPSAGRDSLDQSFRAQLAEVSRSWLSRYFGVGSPRYHLAEVEMANHELVVAFEPRCIPRARDEANRHEYATFRSTVPASTVATPALIAELTLDNDDLGTVAAKRTPHFGPAEIA